MTREYDYDNDINVFWAQGEQEMHKYDTVTYLHGDLHGDVAARTESASRGRDCEQPRKYGYEEVYD